MAADFLLLDMMVPECLPSHDFEWELDRYCNCDQVAAVVVEGNICMFNGGPLNWSVDELKTERLRIANSITTVKEIKRCHGVSGNYRSPTDSY